MPYIVINSASAAAAPVLTSGAPLTSVGTTFLQYQDEMKLSLGGRDDLDLARIKRWINDAYIDLVSSLMLPEFRGSFSITTVADQPLYNLPIQVGIIHQAAIKDSAAYSSDDGIPLYKIDYDIYRKYAALKDDVHSFFRYGQILVLYPNPNRAATIVIEYQIRPDEMVNDTHSPIIPREFHEGLGLLALSKAHMALMEYESSAIAKNEYVSFMRRRQDATAQERVGSIAAVRRVNSSRDLRRMRTNPERDW